MNKVQNRPVWVDIMRGILIILVVIEHVTGRFNSYIYQFHVGAFFVLSGYVSRQDKRGVVETIYNKFMTLFLPVFSAFLLMLFVTVILVNVDLYDILFNADMPFVGVATSINQFFTRGALYTCWLGVAWFILVLLFGCHC